MSSSEQIACMFLLFPCQLSQSLQVSQRDGVDLDPHSLKFKPRQSDGEFGQKKAVGADVGKVQQGESLLLPSFASNSWRKFAQQMWACAFYKSCDI